MRILNINKFYHIQGGADRHYFDLTKLLERHGHKVIPFSMRSDKNEPSPHAQYFVNEVDLSRPKFSFKTLATLGRIFYSLEAKRKIRALIQKEKPEIAHIHNIYHQISPSILGILKKHKIPIVMTVNDYKLICPNYQLFQHNKVCEKCRKKKYYQCFLNKCVKDSYLASLVNTLEMYFHKAFHFYERYVNIFICPSKFMRQKLTAWGLPQAKLVTLPYFIKEENLLSAKEKNYILFFGRLSPEKGLDLLISVMQKLPEIKLKIAGEGPEKEKLEAYIQKNYITNIQFLGYKQGDELKKIIRQSRFVVVPSSWQEVFGLVVLESFNLGKVVLASKKGGLQEIIREGSTGFFFQNAAELEKKIQSLYQNREVTRKIGQRAKREIRRYNPEIYYQNLMKIYQFARQGH
ncbi:MAG: glycosyltransferase family 4 protein [Patescibacteria group bacterium]|nr:glycosyltransferase family 4 protein [Patescibacteria group bacterium]